MKCTEPKYIYRELLYPDGILRNVKIAVPCGKCEACLLTRQQIWRIRLNEEFRASSGAIFFTLTYDELSLPYHLIPDLETFKDPLGPFQKDPIKSFNLRLRNHYDNPVIRLTDFDTDEKQKEFYENYFNYESVVCKRDIQLFIKRLRKLLWPKKLRYFICSEYGPTTGRPHYHGILFGIEKTNFISDEKNLSEIRSILEDVWPYGFVNVDFCNGPRCNYCAKYCVKPAAAVSVSRTPPFILCSRRPGIGASYFDRYDRVKWHLSQYQDTYVAPSYQDPKKVYKSKLPRYYAERIFDYGERAMLSLRHRCESVFDERFEIDELWNIDPDSLYLYETERYREDRPRSREEIDQALADQRAYKEYVHNKVNKSHKGGKRSKDV